MVKNHKLGWSHEAIHHSARFCHSLSSKTTGLKPVPSCQNNESFIEHMVVPTQRISRNSIVYYTYKKESPKTVLVIIYAPIFPTSSHWNPFGPQDDRNLFLILAAGSPFFPHSPPPPQKKKKKKRDPKLERKGLICEIV